MAYLSLKTSEVGKNNSVKLGKRKSLSIIYEYKKFNNAGQKLLHKSDLN